MRHKTKTWWRGALLVALLLAGLLGPRAAVAAQRNVLGSLRLDPAAPTLTGVAILLVQDFGMTAVPLPTPPPANVYVPFAMDVEEGPTGTVTSWTVNTALVLTNTNEGESLQVNLLFLNQGGAALSLRSPRPSVCGGTDAAVCALTLGPGSTVVLLVSDLI